MGIEGRTNSLFYPLGIVDMHYNRVFLTCRNFACRFLFAFLIARSSPVSFDGWDGTVTSLVGTLLSCSVWVWEDTVRRLLVRIPPPQTRIVLEEDSRLMWPSLLSWCGMGRTLWSSFSSRAPYCTTVPGCTRRKKDPWDLLFSHGSRRDGLGMTQ